MIHIHRTLPEEVRLLATIQKEAFRPLYEKYHDPGSPYLRGEEDIALRLSSDIFRYFTIWENDEVVGGIFYRCRGRVLHGELQVGDYYLSRLYIRPDRQSRGIGRDAICLCEKEFPDARRYFVDFPRDLEKNRRCYEKAGFRDTGICLPTDPGIVLCLMVKEIKPACDASTQMV